MTIWHGSLNLFFKTWKVKGGEYTVSGVNNIGDYAYIHQMYMAIPLKGQQIGYKDAYIFIPQLRILIEHNFGICPSLGNSSSAFHVSSKESKISCHETVYSS